MHGYSDKLDAPMSIKLKASISRMLEKSAP